MTTYRARGAFILLGISAAVSVPFISAQDGPDVGAGDAVDAKALNNPVPMSEGSVRAGKQVYVRFCVTCHGLDGKGNTDKVEFLKTKPSDLTDDRWKYGATDGEIFAIIRDGTENDMEAFKDRLPDIQMWHIVNYLRSIGPKPEVNPPADDVLQNPVAYSPESTAAGKQVYLRFCVKCHGFDGKGHTEMVEFLSTEPSDLTDGKWKYGALDGQLFQVIKDGTEYDMEAFVDRLFDDQIWHVINYLRSIGPKPGGDSAETAAGSSQ